MKIVFGFNIYILLYLLTMKTIIFIFLTFCVIACGDNSVNPPGNNPVHTADTVTLFTKDSIHVTIGTSLDSVEYSGSVDTLHISFTYVAYNAGCNIYAHGWDTTYAPATVTKDYHLKFPIGSTFNCKIKLMLTGIVFPPAFASLRNIRLFYIRYQ